MAEAKKKATRKAPAKRRTRRSRRKGGRPRGSTKLEQLITYVDAEGAEKEITRSESIIRSVRMGVPLKYAAMAAGIDESNVHRALARGKEFSEDPNQAPDGERVYAVFASDVERARGAAVGFHVAQLFKAASAGSWRASLEWLRTQAPDEFKRRIGVELEGSERKPPPLVPETLEVYRRAWVAAYGPELPELDPDDLAPPDPEDEEEA